MKPQRQKPYEQRKGFTKTKKFDKKRRPITFEQMLRQFKKKVDRSGIILECRKRAYYEKPAQKRQRKKAEAILRQRRRDAENELGPRVRWH
jgi:ribosomal protein S21